MCAPTTEVERGRGAPRGYRRPITAVLFDKDGTLFEYRATWIPINQAAAEAVSDADPTLTRKLLRSAGYDPDNDRLKPGGLLAAGNTGEIAQQWHNVIVAEAAEKGAVPSVEEITRRVERVYREQGPSRSVPVGDLAAICRTLSCDGYALGLATSDSEQAAEKTLTRFGIRRRFTVVLGYDSGYGPKPEPGMVKAFCAATGVSASEVAVVGDTPHDIEMARRSGAGLAVAVLTGASGRTDLEAEADHVIDSIEALPELLRATRRADKRE